MEKLLLWTFKKNIKIFDFTVGDEFYKNLWSNNKFDVYESLTANSNKGKLIILFIDLKNILRQIPILKKINDYLKKNLL